VKLRELLEDKGLFKRLQANTKDTNIGLKLMKMEMGKL
jgi:hypothetical protein